MAAADLGLLSHRLRVFARTAAAGVSPLYAHLSERAADDAEVAGLLTATSAALPILG